MSHIPSSARIINHIADLELTTHMPRLPGKKAKARKDVTHALKDSATSDVSDGFTLCPKNVVVSILSDRSWLSSHSNFAHDPG